MSGSADRGGGPPLLTTKLHPPRRRRGTVERRRLTDRASGGLPALVLVSAPAGFGKTTFLSQLIASDPARRTAWLALDAGDNDPSVFWSYLTAAVRALDDDAGTGPDAGLAGIDGGAPDVAAAALLNHLATRPGPVLLVLDDYHVIEAPEIHEALAFLVEHLPENAHLVLAGRSDPPLPLARLRARGELLEVRAADLRFTQEEATAYFGESAGLTLTATQVETLEARTEGWAAALQLAALSMQGREDPAAFIADFAGDDRFVVDYLAEEVLERQPLDVRRFLLETSVLDRFTAELCDAVTGRDDGRLMLAHLDRANLFLVALDDRRGWFRYHHLFADVLRARLLAEAPGDVDALHRRASAWYDAAGEPAAAIGHALAGRDVEAAARLIELAAPMMRRTRQEVTLRNWLTALPPELFPDRPVLSMELVGARMISGDVHGVESVLADVDRWFAPGADLDAAVVFHTEDLGRLPAQSAVYRAALALVAGDLAESQAHAERTLGLAEPDDHLRRGAAAALVGLARWTAGDLDEAGRRHTEAIAELTAAGHVSDALGASIALADMRLAQCRSGDARAVFESGLELARRHDIVRGTADMHAGLCEVHLERGDVETAARHLDAALALGDAAGLPQHPYRRRVAAAGLCRARGDLDGALRLLAEAEPLYDTDLSPPVRPVAAMRARALVAAGDLDGARRWVAASGVQADDEPTYLHEYEHATLARVVLARGDADAAVDLLECLRVAASDAGRAGSVVELLVALAVALDVAGRRADATAALSEALAGAAPEGRVRPFREERPALDPLLRMAAASGGAGGELARAVLGPARPPASPPPTSARGLVDPLSERELEVLHLLRGDQSGPEIARELIVSLNTLRTHTRNIYTKLGVTNRREAVTRAAELGL